MFLRSFHASKRHSEEVGRDNCLSTDVVTESHMFAFLRPAVLRTCSLLCTSRACQRAVKSAREASSLPRAPPLRSLDTSNDNRDARKWIDSFREAKLGREDVQLSFARSSGPGGSVLYSSCLSMKLSVSLSSQNVNKVNSKAVVRCALTSPWIPLWAQDHLRASVRSPISPVHALLLIVY